MLTPFRLDLAGDRWVPFIATLPFGNIDLTGATFAMHVRAVADVTGSPLVNLTTVTTASAEGVRLIDATTATLAAHLAAGRIDAIPSGINPATGVAYASTDSVAVSRVGIRINETTMEGLPFPDERGDSSEMVWDLHVTPSGGVKEKYAGGIFTVRAGATQ